MKCNYCGTDDRSGKTCDKCGAPLPDSSAKADRSQPFFHNGYICYTLRDYAMDVIETQFWLGHDLIERIVLPFDFVRTHFDMASTDAFDFVWDLFLLAQGEKEVLEVQEKNNKYPALFEIRHIENPDKQRWSSLDKHDLLREFAP
jgi:hypothetical protein